MGKHHRNIDISGQQIDYWTIIKKFPRYKNGRTYYLCKCKCGKEKMVLYHSLIAGESKSCGCRPQKSQFIPNTYRSDDKYIYLDILNMNEPAVLDKEDYEKIKMYNWHKMKNNYIRTSTHGKKREHFLIHRLIMGINDKNIYVDHIDGNPLNNRKENLRLVSPIQNCWNHKIKKNNTSGVCGVKREHNCTTWSATITVNYKVINLGNYKNFEDAVKARKEAEIKYYGEYRRETNDKCEN